MLKVLEGFNNKIAIRIAGITARRMTIGYCECTPVIEALETGVVWPIKEYIQPRRSTIAVQVVFRPIYYMCTGSEWMSGTSKFIRCWGQDMGLEEE